MLKDSTIDSQHSVDPGNARKTGTTITVLQISDMHLLSHPDQKFLGINTEESFHAVVDLAKSRKWPPDLILFTGDLAQDSSYDAYVRLQHYLARLECPCYCLPGNHDDLQIMKNIFAGDNVSCQDQVILPEWQIICLNSKMIGGEGGHIASDELQKLDRLLSELPDKYALVSVHHHCLPVGSRWLDTMVIDNRSEFFAVLQSHKQVRAVVCGHIHQHLDVRYGNLRILGTPSTCFQFKPNSEDFALDMQPAGYRWIDLCADGSIETAVSRLAELPQGLDINSSGY